MSLLSTLVSQFPQRYYLGVDIGYREHVAAIISLETFTRGGDVWLRTPTLAFASTRAGLRELHKYLDRFSTSPTDFFGLCEPTGGYYGAVVYQYLLSEGYSLQWVENSTTKAMREKIFGKAYKTDDLDARVLARIGYLHEMVGEEFTLRPVILPKPDDAVLLAVCRDHWKLSTMLTRARNQFSQLMAMVFPELKTFFTSSVSTRVPVSLMAAYPSPALLAEAEASAVQQVLRQARGYEHAHRTAALQELARESAGIVLDPLRAQRQQWLTDFLQQNWPLLDRLENTLKELVGGRSDYGLLQPMPYSGSITLGTLLAVTGDIHRFHTYRQYVAYLGYFPGLEKSQTIDRTKMSRKGNRDARRALYQIAAPMIWFSDQPNAYRELYDRKLEVGRKPYQALAFVCTALARHIYHCLKTGEIYNVERTFKRRRPAKASEEQLQAIIAAHVDEFADLEAALPLQESS